MDPRPFRAMIGAYDTLVVWDYTTLDGLPALPQDRPIDLIAWSMGVWAAGHVLQTHPLASATAVNGTPWAIDETRGIPRAIFDGTLAGFSEAGLLRFQRRMCGGAAALKAFEALAPQRTVADLQTELAALGQAITRLGAAEFPWRRAYAAADDRIFPHAAQLAAFPNAITRPGAHWAPALFEPLLRGEEP